VHELGICRSLIDVALGAMSDRGITSPADRVNVEIGRFTSVVPDSLRFYFDILRSGTLLERAELEITSVPLRTHCPACQIESEPDQPSLTCPACGGLVAILAGRELRVTSVDVADAAA
jgi:hydrogenase nickel incorporation protein HypA/HybF